MKSPTIPGVRSENRQPDKGACVGRCGTVTATYDELLHAFGSPLVFNRSRPSEDDKVHAEWCITPDGYPSFWIWAYRVDPRECSSWSIGTTGKLTRCVVDWLNAHGFKAEVGN